MRIESIHIHGFGCLADRHYAFPDGKAVLIVESNEQGKSTLAAAILAGLCGLPSRKSKDDPMKLKEVYRPWNSDAYAVSLDLDADGKKLTVERDFAKDGFTVRERDTNRDVSAQFEADLASHFLRLPRDDFQRIAFISGKEVNRFSSLENIRDRLSALVEVSPDDSGAETAISSLENAGYLLGGKQLKVETAITRLSKAIADKQARANEIEAALDAADVHGLDEALARRDALTATVEHLDAEYVAARLAEVRERIAGANTGSAEVASLEDEMSSLEQYAAFPAERRGQLAKVVTRLGERKAQLDELRSQANTVNAQADELRIRVQELALFARADDDDLVALKSAEDSLRGAIGAADASRHESAAKSNSPSRTLGRVLAGAGALCVMAGLALMITGLAQMGTSVSLSMAGVVIGAAGLVQMTRASAANAEARARAAQADESLTTLRQNAAKLLTRLGTPCRPEDALPDSLARTRDALSKFIADRAELRGAELDLAAGAREVAARQDQAQDERRIIDSILCDAGVDASLPLDDSLRRFEEAADHHSRYRDIRDKLLPALSKRNLPIDALAKLESEEADLAAQAAAHPADTSRASSEVEAERQACRGLEPTP